MCKKIKHFVDAVRSDRFEKKVIVSKLKAKQEKKKKRLKIVILKTQIHLLAIMKGLLY